MRIYLPLKQKKEGDNTLNLYKDRRRKPPVSFSDNAAVDANAEDHGCDEPDDEGDYRGNSHPERDIVVKSYRGRA